MHVTSNSAHTCVITIISTLKEAMVLHFVHRHCGFLLFVFYIKRLLSYNHILGYLDTWLPLTYGSIFSICVVIIWHIQIHNNGIYHVTRSGDQKSLSTLHLHTITRHTSACSSFVSYSFLMHSDITISIESIY